MRARVTIGRSGRRCVRAGVTMTVVTGLVVLGMPSAQAATLVGSWNMDQNGTITDQTHRHPDGTLDNVGHVPGASGRGGDLALDFAGTPSFALIPDASDLNPGTGTFKISLKIRFAKKPSASVGDFDVLRKGLSTTAGGSYKIEILESGKANCNYRSPGSEAQISTGKNLADNRWHTITCTRTATQVILGVDGKSYARNKVTKSIANTSDLWIGAKNALGEDQTTAAVDDVTITAG